MSARVLLRWHLARLRLTPVFVRRLKQSLCIRDYTSARAGLTSAAGHLATEYATALSVGGVEVDQFSARACRWARR